MRLTKNFTLGEFTKSPTASKHGINNNIPNGAVMGCLQNLAETLQIIRDMFGVPIKITSGFRSESLNEKIDGSERSHHMLGCAADIRISGYEQGIKKGQAIKKIADNKEIEFCQLINEYPNNSNGGWIHISVFPDNRRQILTMQ